MPELDPDICALVSIASRIVARQCGPFGVRAITIDADGLPVPLTIPVCRGTIQAAAPTSTPALPAARHSPDFRSVHWYGSDHVFNPTEALVVRALWEAWVKDAAPVPSETLLAVAGTSARKLKDVFRDNPALGSMIVNCSRGHYRLVEPE